MYMCLYMYRTRICGIRAARKIKLSDRYVYSGLFRPLLLKGLVGAETINDLSATDSPQKHNPQTRNL